MRNGRRENGRREPVAIINSLVTFVEAVLALTVGFGLINLISEQVGLLMAVVITFGNVVTVMWTRNEVTPVADPRNFQGRRLVPENLVPDR